MLNARQEKEQPDPPRGVGRDFRDVPGYCFHHKVGQGKTDMGYAPVEEQSCREGARVHEYRSSN